MTSFASRQFGDCAHSTGFTRRRQRRKSGDHPSPSLNKLQSNNCTTRTFRHRGHFGHCTVIVATSAPPFPRRGIFSCTPEPHVAFSPIFLATHFLVFETHIQKWVIYVRRRPLTFQNVCITSGFFYPDCLLTSIIVRVCVKESPAEGDAFTQTRLVPTFGVSTGLSAEGPKVLGFRV